MIRLSKSQVLLIHDQLISETGGSFGLRDEGMLVFLALNGIELQYTQSAEDVPDLYRHTACIPHRCIQS